MYHKNITKNNMSSSQLAIFCIIMIALFPLHECMCLYLFPFVHHRSLPALQSHHNIFDNYSFCPMILLLLFVYIVVHGQGLNAGNAAKKTCKQMNCNPQDKNRSCSCCVTNSGIPLWCHKSKDECTLRCTKPLNPRT